MYFRVLLMLFMSIFHGQTYSTDLLKERILIFNQVEAQNIMKIDSSSIVVPYQKYYSDYVDNIKSQIIKERINEKLQSGVLLVLAAVFFIKYILGILGISLIQIIKRFFNFNYEGVNLNFLVRLIFYLLFVVFLSITLSKCASDEIYLSQIAIIFSIFLLFKYLILWILNYIFRSNTKVFKIANELFTEFVVSFVILFLPMLGFLALYGTKISNTHILIMLLYSFLIYIYYNIKVSVHSFKSIVVHPIYSIFYLIAIEIIPLLLLFKIFYFLVNNG